MSIKAGAASQTLLLFITDTSGNPLTGLAYNTAGLTCYYARAGAAAVAVTLATQTAAGAWASGGFCAIDGTNMPGWYRLDIPNAAIAAGVAYVGVSLKGAASMSPNAALIPLVAYDPQDAAALGLSRLDATISSRAATGAAMTLASNSVTAAAVAADAVAEIATAAAAAVVPVQIRTTPLRSSRRTDVVYTRGATSPSLLDSVVDADGHPIDLTGRTVTVSLLRLGGTYIFQDHAASLGDWPAGGQVSFDWSAGDLDTPGSYTVIWDADGIKWSTPLVVE